MAVDISEKLLEAIQLKKGIEPDDLDTNHEVDAYIMKFCGWEEEG